MVIYKFHFTPIISIFLKFSPYISCRWNNRFFLFYLRFIARRQQIHAFHYHCILLMQMACLSNVYYVYDLAYNISTFALLIVFNLCLRYNYRKLNFNGELFQKYVYLLIKTFGWKIANSVNCWKLMLLSHIIMIKLFHLQSSKAKQFYFCSCQLLKLQYQR